MCQPRREEWQITHGAQRVVIDSLGGGIRCYTVGGTDVLQPYGAGSRPPAARGQLLVPWPNRVRDGRYTFRGVHHQLEVTDPETRTALHGLARWLPWRAIMHTRHSVTVGLKLLPKPGWDGRLKIRVTYALADDGLTVRSTVENDGVRVTPFGYGAHPYVAIGGADVGAVVLQVPAALMVQSDERHLPVRIGPVPPDCDFRSARPLGATPLVNAAFSGLTQEAATGRWVLTVAGLPGGRSVSVWADETLDWVQIYADRTPSGLSSGALGVAIEPMSCPPDAFNSGIDLVALEPGVRWQCVWGITSHGGHSQGGTA